MTTVREIIEAGDFTEKEIQILKFLNLALSDHFGDTFTDVDCKDIAEGCEIDINGAKGVVGSLMKKGILKADRFRGGDGKNYECFYFTDQHNLEFESIY